MNINKTTLTISAATSLGALTLGHTILEKLGIPHGQAETIAEGIAALAITSPQINSIIQSIRNKICQK